jgi:hypothetical protein
MKHRVIWTAMAVLLSLLIAVPALAAAPASGTVVEGDSVPGLAIGDTRADTEASFGAPEACQDFTGSNPPAVDNECRFPVEDGGTVTVHFEAAAGGPAEGTSTDVVNRISWNQSVPGWTTTAGVNTALALDDPEAVLAAYPDAYVIYNTLFGNVEYISDTSLGITIDYVYMFYVGKVAVYMSIYEPYESTPPPPPEQVITVGSVDLYANKVKGNRTVSGFVLVRDQTGYGAEGATVTATWIFPDGSTREVSDATSEDGWVWFRLDGVKNGYYTLSVDDVVLDGFRLDTEASVMSGTVRAK